VPTNVSLSDLSGLLLSESIVEGEPESGVDEESGL
jgi:hypothetical protein